MRRSSVSALLSLMLMAIAATPAASDEVADFYRGKQIKLIIGYAPGTGYDIHARLLGRHLGRHIPGEPTVIPQTMEGAGSLRAGLYVYNVAEKDGLTIGAMNRSMVLAPLLGTLEGNQTNFDPRQYGWVGSINSATTVGVVWAASGISKFDDLRQKEVIVSSDQTTSDSYVFAKLMNNLLGTKLKIVTGYSGTTASYLAMERGETTGYMGTSYSSLKATKPDWIRDKKVNILIQVALKPDPELPNVPIITALAKTDAEKQALELLLAPQEMSRPYMTTPGVPPQRLAALRKAFMDTMKDPAFIADAQKLSIDIDPMDGKDINALVEKIYKTSPEAVEAAKRAIAVEKK
jgi:tripartite-type tricarboxylate transporter receptor subunit TctC